MTDRLRVNEVKDLMAFLVDNLRGWSRNTIKQRLKVGCVTVNGEPVLKHNHILQVGDDVEVLAAAKFIRRETSTLEILYSDKELIAINKPAGLLSVATTRENKQHALAILRNQFSRSQRSIKLWPVNRLDRDTSGVLLFATSREMRESVMAQWTEAEKIYLAIVEGHPNPSCGTINQPLRLDDTEYRMHVGQHPEAKAAITHYVTRRTAPDRALLELQLETGRQHQIRAHMAWLGHPVIGDPRYGKAGPRMGLHALRLSIKHPQTGKQLAFETPAPDDFYALLA
ncbi:MAG: RluA family pseudouridine synthase [Gammaproteobacteria bacterium]|nr:RluA family pseudouridine synthase [Gammaproteobacteria bacterium]